MAIAVQLQGRLSVRETSCDCDGSSSPGNAYSFGLKPATRSAAIHDGQRSGSVDSPVGFAPQPWADNLAATYFYLSIKTDAAMTIRLTREVSGDVDIVVQGHISLELGTTDRATGLAIQGQGKFEWSATGAEV